MRIFGNILVQNHGSVVMGWRQKTFPKKYTNQRQFLGNQPNQISWKTMWRKWLEAKRAWDLNWLVALVMEPCVARRHLEVTFWDHSIQDNARDDLSHPYDILQIKNKYKSWLAEILEMVATISPLLLMLCLTYCGLLNYDLRSFQCERRLLENRKKKIN